MAIVLPDGLLQNTTVGYVRQWLRANACVDAVVSLPQETFIPYGTGIKTSILFLRKKPSPSRPCFMARVRVIGYDVKGQPLHRKTPDGQLVLADNGRPILDDETPEVAAAFSARTTSGDRTFLVNQRDFNSRLDVEHYLPSDLLLLKRLEESGALPLTSIASFAAPSRSWRDDPEAGIRYVAISDIDPRTMEIVNVQAMRAHEAPSRATYVLREGDIVSAVSGASTGTRKHATAMARTETEGAVCSNGLAVLRDIRGVEPLYLLAYLRTDVFLRQVRRLMTGHAIPSISLDDLGTVRVPIPPADVQARVIEKVQKLRALRRRAMEQSDVVVDTLNDVMAPLTTLGATSR